jgi:hypothetical protein
MQLVELFYCICWVTTISTIWFLTDTWYNYAQAFGVWEEFRKKYVNFVRDKPGAFFPDFLYKLSLIHPDPGIKFFLKLVSCPFCLIFWLSIAAMFFVGDYLLIAPIYIISLITFLQIKRMS